MTNLDKVREALKLFRNFPRGYSAAQAALSALSAHEEEVRELVKAAQWALPYVERIRDAEIIRAALSKLKEPK